MLPTHGSRFGVSLTLFITLSGVALGPHSSGEQEWLQCLMLHSRHLSEVNASASQSLTMQKVGSEHFCTAEVRLAVMSNLVLLLWFPTKKLKFCNPGENNSSLKKPMLACTLYFKSCEWRILKSNPSFLTVKNCQIPALHPVTQCCSAYTVLHTCRKET